MTSKVCKNADERLADCEKTLRECGWKLEDYTIHVEKVEGVSRTLGVQWEWGLSVANVFVIDNPAPYQYELFPEPEEKC